MSPRDGQVQLPLQHPELFASGVRKRSGILLFGEHHACVCVYVWSRVQCVCVYAWSARTWMCVRVLMCVLVLIGVFVRVLSECVYLCVPSYVCVAQARRARERRC